MSQTHVHVLLCFFHIGPFNGKAKAMLRHLPFDDPRAGVITIQGTFAVKCADGSVYQVQMNLCGTPEAVVGHILEQVRAIAVSRKAYRRRLHEVSNALRNLAGSESFCKTDLKEAQSQLKVVVDVCTTVMGVYVKVAKDVERMLRVNPRDPWGRATLPIVDDDCDSPRPWGMPPGPIFGIRGRWGSDGCWN